MLTHRLLKIAAAFALTSIAACSGDTAPNFVPALASISVRLETPSIAVGTTTQAFATLVDSSGRTFVVVGDTVSWTSTNPAVATIAPATGVVTALTAGKTTIRASMLGKTDEKELTVSDTPAPTAPVATINLAIQSPVLVGQAVAAVVSMSDAAGSVLSGRSATWSSSDTTVATVSAIGVVTGVKAGTTTVSVTSEGITVQSTVKVVPPTVALASLLVQVQPAGAASGVAFTQQPTVTILNSEGALNQSANLAITVSVAGGSGTLSGTTTVTASGGIATFSDLKITGAGSHTLNFTTSTPSLITTSSSFAVSAAVATSLSVTTQPSASATNGVAFAQQPVIQLRDASNGAVQRADVVVTASIASGGGTLGGTTTATTDANGVATFTGLSLTGTTGARALRFDAAGLTNISSNAIAVGAGAAKALVMSSQPSATATSGQVLAAQPSVQLADVGGNAISQSGVAVTAAIASGSGTLSGTMTATTNASGVATFGGLTITGTGSHMIGFTAAGLSGAVSSFILVSPAGPNPATQVTITTQPSASTQSGVAFAQQPVVQLRDASGTAVAQSGVVVTATIATGGGSIGGTATALTNASGTATFSNLSITGVVGSRTLSFTVNGLTGATSSAIAVAAGAATKLVITTQPSTSVANAVVLTRQPVVQLQDASGNNVAQSGVMVTAAIATGGGTLGGTMSATTDANGTAQFSGLQITGLTGSRTLSFSVNGVTVATSSSISVTPGAAAKIVITTQPSTSVASGTAFATQPVVRIQDVSGNSVSQAVSVTASIASGTGTLGGTATVTTNASGIGTFSGLSITGAGAYTIKFASGTLTAATSGSINVAGAATPAKLVVATQPPASAATGGAFTPQPIVQITDASGTAVAAAGVSVTVALTGANGTLGGTATAVTDASGAARFTSLSISGTGSYSLVFTSSSMTVTSNAITVAAAAQQTDGCTNEPAGSTRFNEQPWDTSPDRTLNKTSMGWIDDAANAGTKISVISDPTSPFPSSNHNVAAGLFRQGDPGGSAPFHIYRPFAAAEQFKTLYVCVYMKHSADFDNTNGNAGTKVFWPAGDQIDGAMTYVTLNGPQMDVGINQQGGVVGNREMYANTGKDGHVYAKRGQWVRYEFLLTASTDNSSANGGLDIWIDGVQTHHYTNVMWQMAAARKWLSMSWNPTYGGGLNPVPHDQYEYIDHMRLSGVP